MALQEYRTTGERNGPKSPMVHPATKNVAARAPPPPARHTPTNLSARCPDPREKEPRRPGRTPPRDQEA